MSNAKSRNQSSNKFSDTIQNPWTGEVKEITANSEEKLEICKQNQFEKWSYEAHIIEGKNAALSQTSKAKDIIEIINHLCFYALDFKVKIYYCRTNGCSLRPPVLAEIRRDCGVPSKFRKIIEFFWRDLKEDRLAKEAQAEKRYQEDKSKYERAISERERTISSLVDSFIPDNIGEIEKYFLYVINLTEDRISDWLGTFFGKPPRALYSKDTHSLHITVELPKAEMLPREKSWHYAEKEDEVKPEYRSYLEQQKLYSTFIYEIALMMIASIFLSDDKNVVNVVHFCGERGMLDKSYGTERLCPIIKVTLTKLQFNQLNLRYVDAYEVWKRIGGEIVSDFSNEIYSEDAIRLISINDNSTAETSSCQTAKPNLPSKRRNPTHGNHQGSH